MSWNGAGVFNRIYSWVADKNAGIDITASRMDTDTDDITSNGFLNTLTRDGQGSATANLPMNNFRHTGVGLGVARTDYAALGQLEDGLINWGVATGTSDAVAVSYSPAITALVDGQLCYFRATAANATTTPTFSPNGLTVETITKVGGGALVAGDIPAALAECVLRYNLANTRWELLNPGHGSSSSLAGLNNWIVAGGTSDAITATYSPAVPSLVDGQLCFFRATAANGTSAPTFAPNGLTAHAITKAGGVALLAGDIPAALAEVILRYNLANTRWELLNPAQTTPVVTPPQGYLTPVSNTPIITSDSISATSIFYTPFVGNLVPIYSGTAFSMFPFSQLTLALAAGSQVIAGIYDVFIFLNSGVLTLAFGPSWVAGTSGSVSAGSCARGTGTGGTALTRINGIWVNAAAFSTANNGATTYAIGQNLATYLGSVFIDATAGQVTCHRSYGQSRKWGIWNAYNRTPVYLKAGDGNASWNYNSVTIRASNGSSANSLTAFSGLAEEAYDFEFAQIGSASAGSSGACANYVGFNSLTAGSGKLGYGGSPVASSPGGNVDLNAKFYAPPALGINVITALESTPTTGGVTNQSFFGTETNMLLSAGWRA